MVLLLSWCSLSNASLFSDCSSWHLSFKIWIANQWSATCLMYSLNHLVFHLWVVSCRSRTLLCLSWGCGLIVEQCDSLWNQDQPSCCRCYYWTFLFSFVQLKLCLLKPVANPISAFTETVMPLIGSQLSCSSCGHNTLMMLWKIKLKAMIPFY